MADALMCRHCLKPVVHPEVGVKLGCYSGHTNVMHEKCWLKFKDKERAASKGRYGSNSRIETRKLLA
jgi:hypothetical protein